MSGAGRKTKYRKGVENEILENLPEPQNEHEQVVRVLGLRGGNIVEVETAEQSKNRSLGLPVGDTELCRLPMRFKNVVWVKRGSFLIAEQASEKDFDGKVKFLCQHVLFTPESIKHLKQRGMFPAEFEQPVVVAAAPVLVAQQDDDEEEEEEEEDFTTINPNRRRQFNREEEESSDDDDEE